ncbi:hypothetical protein [Pseudoalteromonas prydzensis]|uniref:hypothetical protein n=1 Tax=Pseudoalteromonas prydzensis TaxID=182141 RepID=UPI000A5AEA27|nr:hypothetical protein [Pseudoalteromonas prydzensis]MBE0377644.1 hypothetical protein [Pseudoalteromonas prydzensis ACAM 620]
MGRDELYLKPVYGQKRVSGFARLAFNGLADVWESNNNPAQHARLRNGGEAAMQ